MAVGFLVFNDHDSFDLSKKKENQMTLLVYLDASLIILEFEYLVDMQLLLKAQSGASGPIVVTTICLLR